MIEFIAHRINTLNELKQIPNQYGVEIDLRDFKNKIVLSEKKVKYKWKPIKYSIII